MVAIDLIVQHVHSQLEEVSDCTEEGGATMCLKAVTQAEIETPTCLCNNQLQTQIKSQFSQSPGFKPYCSCVKGCIILSKTS